MNCNEIENSLPAYQEGLLSPEEAKAVAEHLASCPSCARSLEELRMTERVVQNLDEVEPPPFFEQRIMARVREEAGQKRGFLKRLFLPLHIKIPIQAVATIVIAVLAFQIYQTNEPEVKQVVPLPLPVTEQAKDQIAAEPQATKAAPPVVAQVAQRPAANLSRKDEQYAPPPTKSDSAEKQISASQAQPPKETPAVPESAAPPAAKAERESFATGAQTLSLAKESAAKQDADRALESAPPERKQKMAAADTTTAPGESRKTVYARLAKDAAVGPSAVELTMQVENTENAIQEVEAYIDQANAKIIEQGRRERTEFLRVEIPGRDLAAFLERLKTVGRVNIETPPPAAPNETVTVNIKITGGK